MLPVKGGATAKSRLAEPGAGRTELARALALDCLSAVVATDAVREVLVVTEDPAVASEAARMGARVVPETRPGAGLSAAVDDGLAATGDGAVAVLLADLPALIPDQLADALAAAEKALDGGARSVVVPDAEGTGTVLLAAAARGNLKPAFGPDSARAHERGGAVRLDLDLPGLRQDVDTAEALAHALSLGVGARTAAVLARA